MKPNLFIVGMQKCGTESLKDWLNQHPDIWMNIDFEPNYFADDVQGCEDYTDFDWYLSLFPKNPKEKYMGEKSARYLCSKEAAKRIKKFNPKAKIIIILRNPLEMLPSLHTHLLQQGLETELDFEKALKKEKFRKKKYGIKFIRNFFYMTVADYYPKIKRFYDEFGSKNVKVVILIDLKKQPQKVYNEITDFLKIRRFTPEFRILNKASRQPKSRWHAKFFYFVQNLPLPIKKFIKTIFPHNTRQRIKKMNLKYLEFKRKMPEKTRKEIIDKLKPNIKKLERLIKKDLSIWYS